MRKHIDFEIADFKELPAGPVQAPAYRAAILALEPLAYYRLGEATGATAADETNAHHGTWVGTAAPGVAGALYRDSNLAADIPAGSYLSLPALFNPASGPFSECLWFNITTLATTATNVLTNQLDTGGTGRSFMFIGGTSLSNRLCSFLGNTHTNGGPSVVAGQWYHAAVTFEAGTLRLYLNGVQIATNTITMEPCSGGFVVGVNKTLDGSYTRGKIDELAFFDKALTAEQLRHLYRLGAGHFDQPS